MRRTGLVLALASLLLMAADDPQDKGAESDKPAGLPKSVGRSARSAPEKAAPNEGTFEATVSSAGKSEKFDSPARAAAAIGRAGARSRGKKGLEPDFHAVININGSSFEFSDPKDAQAVCSLVGQAVGRLRKVRAGLGDLGELTPAEAPPLPGAKGDAKSSAAERAAAMQKVRQRINKAIQDEVRKYRRPVNPIRTRQIVLQEIQKAQQEGLIPAPQQPAPAGVPAAGGDRRTAEIEYVRTLLEQALSNGKPVEGGTDGESKEDGKDEIEEP